MRVSQHTTESIEIVMLHEEAALLRGELAALIVNRDKLEPGSVLARLMPKLDRELRKAGAL